MSTTIQGSRAFQNPNTQLQGGYTVKPGDTLTAIARDNGVSLQALIAANPQIENPDLIFPGQLVQLPQAAPAPASSPAVDSSAPAQPSAAPEVPASVGQRLSGGKPQVANGGLSQALMLALRFGDAIRSRSEGANLPGVDLPPPGAEEPDLGIAGEKMRSRSEDGPIFDPTPSVRISGPTLREGSKGDQVEALQTRLSELGYSVGVDGSYGRLTKAAVRQFQVANGLKSDGVVGPDTMDALNSAAAKSAPEAGALDTSRAQYAPNSPDAIALFEEAAERAGLPKEWASSPALHELLRLESNGEVGRPNYTYGSRAQDPAQWDSIQSELKRGEITAKSSATGLGQLLLDNVEAYYPSGRAGIGDPVEEAAGMLKYISARYGSPEKALTTYGTIHEGY